LSQPAAGDILARQEANVARTQAAAGSRPAGTNVLTAGRLGTVLKRAIAGWWNDNVPRMGAALAYYTLFSLAPILIVAIAVAGLVFGPEAVRGEIVGQVEGLVGHDGALAVQAMLEGAANPSSSVPATIVGIVTFFLGATGAFLELQADLDAIWRVKPKSRGSVLRDLLMQRFISFGLVLGFAFLLLTSLVVSAALAAMHTYMGNAFPGVAVLWEALNVLVSLGVITLLFAMIYKVLPDVKLAWRDVWVGALVTAGFFTVGKFLIGLYIGTSALTSTYGAAGSVIVILVWVYYSSQIILLGAEFTRAYVERFGKLPPPEEFATKARKPVSG
jgi:membrane protein